MTMSEEVKHESTYFKEEVEAIINRYGKMTDWRPGSGEGRAAGKIGPHAAAGRGKQ